MQSTPSSDAPVAPAKPSANPGAGARQLLIQPFRILLVVATVAYVLASVATTTYAAGLGSEWQLLAGVAIFLAFAAGGGWLFVLVPLGERLTVANLDIVARANYLEDRQRAHDIDGRLQHALEIAEDEAAVLRISEQALGIITSAGSSSQLLLADDPDGDVSRVITAGDMPDAARCKIRRPGDCPAVRRGQGMVYEDSMALSACPGLGGRIETTCAAACTPVIVGGRGTGMLRALGETGDSDLFRLLQRLTTHANRVGTRLTVIRSMVASEMKAATDPLTGLGNRRVLETRLNALLDRREEFAIVMVDIDHFKKINDDHGHEIGDRALKAFANVLRQSIRSEDLACRIGGEEFVLLLPGFDAQGATQVTQRLRAELPRVTQRGGLPGFTVSGGVVDHRHAGTSEDLLRVADQLMYRAKTEGRNRMLVADEVASEDAATS